MVHLALCGNQVTTVDASWNESSVLESPTRSFLIAPTRTPLHIKLLYALSTSSGSRMLIPNHFTAWLSSTLFFSRIPTSTALLSDISPRYSLLPSPRPQEPQFESYCCDQRFSITSLVPLQSDDFAIIKNCHLDTLTAVLPLLRF